MNRYLILIEKVLNLKEHIEKLILEGKFVDTKIIKIDCLDEKIIFSKGDKILS